MLVYFSTLGFLTIALDFYDDYEEQKKGFHLIIRLPTSLFAESSKDYCEGQ